MQNLINPFEFRDRKVFGDFQKTTKNKVVKYDVEFNLKKACWNSYFKQRVASSILTFKKGEANSLKQVLGLSTATRTSNIAIKTTDYLTYTSIQIVQCLTKYANPNDLLKNIGFCEISLSGLLLDTVRSINCHYRTRRLHNTNSVILGKSELKVETDAIFSESEKFEIEELYYNLINYNQIIEILKLDKLISVNSIDELYQSNQFDLCIDVKYNSNSQFNVLIPDGHEDANLICGLLTQPHYTKTSNATFQTDLVIISEIECLSLLTCGKVENLSILDINVLEESVIEAKLNSNYSQFSNKSFNFTKISGYEPKKTDEKNKDADDVQGIVMPK